MRAAGPNPGGKDTTMKKGLMDTLMDAINEGRPEGERFERLHSPQGVYDARGGLHDIHTGQYVRQATTTAPSGPTYRERIKKLEDRGMDAQGWIDDELQAGNFETAAEALDHLEDLLSTL
jgi:hypothetical protein